MACLTTSGVVVPERTGTLLLQRSGKYLPQDQILLILKLNCVKQLALLNDAA